VLTNISVEEHAKTTRVEPSKLAEVVNNRVDDDPQVAGLVVLSDLLDGQLLERRSGRDCHGE